MELMEVVGIEGSRVLFERFRPPHDTVLKRYRVASELEQAGCGASFRHRSYIRGRPTRNARYALGDVMPSLGRELTRWRRGAMATQKVQQLQLLRDYRKVIATATRLGHSNHHLRILRLYRVSGALDEAGAEALELEVPA